MSSVYVIMAKMPENTKPGASRAFVLYMYTLALIKYEYA